jgi:hypothetical protein
MDKSAMSAQINCETPCITKIYLFMGRNFHQLDLERIYR